jgi:tRNA A-37 threonylcarbamoyl transferase component Bud32
MKTQDALPIRVEPDPPTIDRPSPPPRAAGGVKVALVPGSAPQLTGEIAALLRRRLRIAALIVSVSLVVYALVISLLVFSQDSRVSAPWFWLVLTFACVVTPVATGLAALLWSSRPLSLAQLRGIELLALGITTAYWSWVQCDLVGHIRLPEHAGQGPLAPLVLARCLALPWFGSTVLYGTFIPNTWRRCAALVGALVLTPLLLSAILGVAEGLNGRLLAPFLFEMAWWMAMAAACAIYGCHKVSLLREQAFEARKLGQYQLKERLGSGGMGEVYLAEHVLLRRPCAIKLIRPDQAVDATSLTRFEREVRATATLTHWNTVEIYDYGHAEDGTFYYVMEYLPGLSLQDLVERHGALPPGRAVHLLRQVCAALCEAHAIGLIHRDIKPSNILACERGGIHDVAKLLDFGIVQSIAAGREAARLTEVGAIAGSPSYMAPEQAAGKPPLDGRGDIYCLGAVAYFLLTGRPPFVRDTVMQTLMAHVYDPVVPPSELRADLPVDLEDVVLRCLAKEAGQRFPDAARLGQALARCACAGDWGPDQAAAWWTSFTDAREAPAKALSSVPLHTTRQVGEALRSA